MGDWGLAIGDWELGIGGLMIGIVALGGFLLVAPLRAQAPADVPTATISADADAQQLFREVMSPFCPGLTLADCPSPNAFTLRDEIRARLAGGDSRQVIGDELVAKYGAAILADPSDTPIGTIVWGVPFVLSALGATGLAWFLRRAVARTAHEPPPAVTGRPALNDRLDDELAALD